MGYVASHIIEGIATGSLYGLIALSIMFVYRSSRVFNFSQGEMATASAYVALVTIQSGYPYLALFASSLFGFSLGWTLDVFLLSLVRNRTELTTIIVTMGVLALINSIDSWFFGYDPFLFPSPFPTGGIDVIGLRISFQSMAALAWTSVVSILLYCFFEFTHLGLDFQAMAEDPVAARLMGIRVPVLVPVAWGLSGVIGGGAGVMVAQANFLQPNTMATILLYALAAAVIGGLQSVFGAIVGGIIVGIAENISGLFSWIGSELKIVAVFTVLATFLTFRPRGIFGRNEPRKI